MSVITSDSVKRHLGGVMAYVDQLGTGPAVQLYADAIAAAEARFERYLGLALERKVIIQRLQNEDVSGETYDVLEPPLDYATGLIDRRTLPRWRMRRRPVQSVQRVRLMFAPQYPVLVIPTDWVRIQYDLGVVTVMPVGSQAALAVQQGLWFMPLVDQSWPWSLIPQFVCVDYTAGYDDPASDPRLGELREYLAKAAAAHVLEAVQGLVPSSVTLDGFSQPFEPIGQRIDRWNAEVEKFLASYARTSRPPRMVVL